uniref:GAG-pre-integrase domain-containing protein n=1 Tax=Davidia involucrata TaxID=16924 RepID=A0A5B6YVA5_DAVIN
MISLPLPIPPLLPPYLLGISRLFLNRFSIHLAPILLYLFFQDPQTGKILGTGRRVGRLFELTSLHVAPPPISLVQSAASTSSSSSLHLWHSRLGHVSVGRLRSLISSGQLGFVKDESFKCLSCQLAKQPALPFNKSESISLAPFDLVAQKCPRGGVNRTFEVL